MNYKSNIRPAWVVLVMLLAFAVVFAMAKRADTCSAKQKTDKTQTHQTPSTDLSKFKNSAENENCLKCHGQSKYSYENKDAGKTVNKQMYSELIIDRNAFYSSNHKEFKCIDCHPEDYNIFPHAGSLRMEAIPTCMDCHGGDENYAKFEFEDVDTAFMASVHAEKLGEDFTCWTCHNPHTYKINARTNENLQETIVYDNLICLNCHGDDKNYQLFSDIVEPNLIDKHDWLPNQASHFTKVRCIECHTRNEDTLIVAHHITPKANAVKKCESCHSKNSILYASLYKFQIEQNIEKSGLIKGLFFSETATIGPDRNNTLNLISLSIFALTLVIILTHAILRIKKSK